MNHTHEIKRQLTPTYGIKLNDCVNHLKPLNSLTLFVLLKCKVSRFKLTQAPMVD